MISTPRAVAIAKDIFRDDPRIGSRRFEQLLFWLLRHHTNFPESFDRQLRKELIEARCKLAAAATRRA